MEVFLHFSGHVNVHLSFSHRFSEHMADWIAILVLSNGEFAFGKVGRFEKWSCGPDRLEAGP
jgi:hypothetical protein